MAERQRGDFRISTETDHLDVEAIHRFLANEAYWALGRTFEQVKRSIENSARCFGVYAGQPGQPSTRQVGFARLVSDMTTFGWLCDVFIVPEARGHGLGKWLMEAVVETVREWGLRRVLLATRDAHELYRGFGFQELPEPARWMILVPD
jgi:GNAT superfamily N-acetyltransferase